MTKLFILFSMSELILLFIFYFISLFYFCAWSSCSYFYYEIIITPIFWVSNPDVNAVSISTSPSFWVVFLVAFPYYLHILLFFYLWPFRKLLLLMDFMSWVKINKHSPSNLPNGSVEKYKWVLLAPGDLSNKDLVVYTIFLSPLFSQIPILRL